MRITAQIKDLRKATPRALTIPSTCVLDDDPCKAVRRWLAAKAAADGCNELDSIYEDDERLRKHPELTALWWLNLAERQATAKMAPKESTHTHAMPEVHPALAKAASLHRSRARLETKTRPDQIKISVAMDERLTELAQLEERCLLIRIELWDLHEELKQIQYRMFDPAVVAGYFHDSHVSVDARRRTALHFYLHEILKLPLLRCLAITGTLRNRRIPVDLKHPELRAVYANELQNLKRFRKRIRDNQGSGHHGIYLTRHSTIEPCSSAPANEATRTRNKS
jgi:hypothetical protein